MSGVPPGGITIMKATFGDNIARRDVTKSVRERTLAGDPEITANESLIPAFDVAPETKLTNDDLADITKKAQEQCQGGADTACMNSTKAKLMQERHAEKAQADTSSANIMVGRSLDIVYMDAAKKIRRAIVPDGQKFKLEGVTVVNNNGKIEKPSIWGPVQKAFGEAAGILWWTLLFVFSVGAAYRVFKIYGNLLLAIFVASLAVILPLGGYSPQTGVYLIIILYGFIEMGKMAKQKAMAAATAPAAPAAPSEDPLAAFKGAAGSVDSVLGSLKGANPMAALQGARANPMAALGSFLMKK